MQREIAKKLALSLALTCVRNTSLEDIHAGKSVEAEGLSPDQILVQAGNQTIPWPEVSRISDAEMKNLMQEVVNKIYTTLLRLDNPDFFEKLEKYSSPFTAKWDEPKELKDWFNK